MTDLPPGWVASSVATLSRDNSAKPSNVTSCRFLLNEGRLRRVRPPDVDHSSRQRQCASATGPSSGMSLATMAASVSTPETCGAGTRLYN
jgi:hypothetical protein